MTSGSQAKAATTKSAQIKALLANGGGSFGQCGQKEEEANKRPNGKHGLAAGRVRQSCHNEEELELVGNHENNNKTTPSQKAPPT